MRRLVIAAIAVCFSYPAASEEFNPPLEHFIADYVRPAVAEFSQSSAKLPDAVSAICAEEKKATISGFYEAFTETVRDFSRIHFLRFGPLVEDDRLSRLAFMPDPRGTGMRQIRKIYAAQDPAVLSPESLRDKSVAVQGLTALQLIAFNKYGEVVLGSSDETRDFDCGYATAIARNVASIAAKLETEWADPKGYSAVLLSAGPDNERFRTSKEALESVFNALVTGVIIMRDQDILPALGSSAEKAKPRRFPFSRSRNAIIYLSGELSGIRDAVNSMNLKPLMSESDRWVLDTLGFEFKNAQSYLDKLTPPLRLNFGKDGSYNLTAALAVTLNAIRDMMAQEVAGALKLAGGFNALDGD
ncbi:imelysin family protein [Roseibium sp. SCP14]|uniref:imelysin family protein n=1 Tax=Roseibium sp. SCP14 TaxID=3141375 RepID=UPI00333B7F7B